MALVKFDVTDEELALIHQIAFRAVLMALDGGVKWKLLDAEMDIAACHANGNPLKLKELLEADDSNFGHDVFGISRHLDRETGQLMDFFTPRYSQQEG